MTPNNNDPKIELTWKQCEAISRYYEFPTAVLFLNEENMFKRLKGTRNKSIGKKLDKLRAAIKEAMDDWND